MSYSPQLRQQLLDIASESIHTGLATTKALKIDVKNYPEELQQSRASFVTLHIKQQLRGCIGSLQAHRALVEDVSENAFAAAFRDPRFAPLSSAEFDQLNISISVLTPATAMSFDSEEDLIRQLQPGEDGLILRAGHKKGTFLPAVWEQLPRAQDFVNQLKLKAGLPAGYWSDSIQVSRYHTESFE